MENTYRNTGFAMLLLLPCIALGFAKTYFGAFSKFFFSISAAVHFHAAAAMAWVLMLIAQPMPTATEAYTAVLRLILPNLSNSHVSSQAASKSTTKPRTIFMPMI